MPTMSLVIYGRLKPTKTCRICSLISCHYRILQNYAKI